MFKLQLGLNNCSNKNYHADVEYLSSSDYKLLLKDPALFYQKKYGTTAIEEEKAYLINGSYVHSKILEPHVTDSEFVVYPELRKAGAAFKAFELQHPGKSILNKGQFETCKRMLKGYQNRPEAVELIKGGLSEHTICVNYNGIPTKVRLDRINLDLSRIIDIKTSAYELDIDSVRSTIEHWNYGLSAALYLNVTEQFYGRPFEFYWLFLSSKTGECQIFKMSAKTRLKGELEIAKAAKIYKQCLATGVWTSEEKTDIVTVNSNYEIMEI